VVAETPSIRTNSQVAISPATWHDVRAVHHLERACFPLDAWPIWDLIGVLTLPGVVRLKAMSGEHLVGFIAGDVRPREKIAWIATFCVHPAYRRQGIGSALLRACEARIHVPRIRLSVRASNHPAISLYHRFGYRKIGVWPRYYQGGENAVVLEKKMSADG